jgi:anti-anti-sigma factor
LLKAIEQFDPERGTAFSSFAVPTMTGELKRISLTGLGAEGSPRLSGVDTARHRTSDRLGPELGRTPTVADIADALEITPEQVLEAHEAAESTSVPEPGDACCAGRRGRAGPCRPQTPAVGLGPVARDLKLDCEVRGTTAEMSVGGDLDMAAAFKIEPAIEDVVRENAIDEVILDLADVEFIDSAGIGSLLSSRERLSSLGIRTTVARPSRAVRHVLDATGTSRVLLS